ncbi:MAG TPA: Gfo/Idh/MocA family oxidoreductase [Trueperaceae bacterium]
MIREPARPLKLGMVGGGRDAFIGGVHRMAARLDGNFDLVAGALSSDPDKAKASGKELGLPADRNYGSWEEMLQGERALLEGERIDAVSIVTPNHVHHPVAKAFVEAGINVICDKPLTTSTDKALDLVEAAQAKGVVFAVTYNYTGYPMVKQARDMVRQGMLGELRKVIVEYNQGWLATKLEDQGAKQAEWRTDPERSGIGGAIGDIGSHAENLVATITGLELESVCAELTTFVPGRRLDDDANLLIRYQGGARGVLIASQIEVGEENDLRIRVYGSEGSIAWRQEDPNQLVFKPLEGPAQIYTRNGGGYLSKASMAHSRLPSGHPEAFIEAFANVYGNVAAAIRGQEADYPTVVDGARGVHFIEKTVESSRSDRKWTPAAWSPAGSLA